MHQRGRANRESPNGAGKQTSTPSRTGGVGRIDGPDDAHPVPFRHARAVRRAGRSRPRARGLVMRARAMPGGHGNTRRWPSSTARRPLARVRPPQSRAAAIRRDKPAPEFPVRARDPRTRAGAGAALDGAGASRGARTPAGSVRRRVCGGASAPPDRERRGAAVARVAVGRGQRRAALVVVEIGRGDAARREYERERRSPGARPRCASNHDGAAGAHVERRRPGAAQSSRGRARPARPHAHDGGSPAARRLAATARGRTYEGISTGAAPSPSAARSSGTCGSAASAAIFAPDDAPLARERGAQRCLNQPGVRPARGFAPRSAGLARWRDRIAPVQAIGVELAAAHRHHSGTSAGPRRARRQERATAFASSWAGSGAKIRSGRRRPTMAILGFALRFVPLFIFVRSAGCKLARCSASARTSSRARRRTRTSTSTSRARSQTTAPPTPPR